MKKNQLAKLVAHRARGGRSAGLVENVLGETVAVISPRRKRATSVTAPEYGDDELPQGGPACLRTRNLR